MVESVRIWKVDEMDGVSVNIIADNFYVLGIMQRHTRLRKVGGSLTTAVPVEIVHVLGLIAGDGVEWEIEDGRAVVKFYKTATNRKPAQEIPQGETADAA